MGFRKQGLVKLDVRLGVKLSVSQRQGLIELDYLNIHSTFYRLNKKPFLLQNQRGGCISIGVIPESFSISLHFSEISSLDKFSACSLVITPKITEHCVTCVSGAISINSASLLETFP